MKVIVIFFYLLAHANGVFCQWFDVMTPMVPPSLISTAVHINEQVIISNYRPYGGILRSMDGGYNYTLLPTPYPSGLNFLSIFENKGKIYLTGSLQKDGFKKSLIRSADYGDNWDTIYVQNGSDTAFLTQEVISILIFFDDNNGIVIGSNPDSCANVWKTDDGGFNWKRLSCDKIVSDDPDFGREFTNMKRVEVFNTTAYTAYHSGTKNKSYFVRAFDNGSKILVDEIVNVKLNTTHTGITFMDSLNGIAGITTSSGLASTSDGGKSWTATDDGKLYGGVSLGYAKRTPAKSGFYYSGDVNGSWFSNDSGKLWKKLDNFSHDVIDFWDAEHGVSFTKKLSANLENARVFTGFPTNIINDNYQSDLSLYPNPAHYYLNIELDNWDFSNSSYLISDVMGKTWQGVFEMNQAQISIEHLPAGIYNLSVTSQDGLVWQGRFVKVE